MNWSEGSVETSQKLSDSRQVPDQAEMTRPRGLGRVGAHPWKGLEATEPTAGWEARQLAAVLPPARTRSHQIPHPQAAFVTNSTKPNKPTQAFTA